MSAILDEDNAASVSRSRIEFPAAPRLSARTPDAPSRWRVPTQRDVGPQSDEPSLGELKARHRELHLCFRCTHHMVCGMAKSLDPNLLVTIATCLGFEPDESEASNDVCELLPLEPLPDHTTDPADDSSSAAAPRDPS